MPDIYFLPFSFKMHDLQTKQIVIHEQLKENLYSLAANEENHSSSHYAKLSSTSLISSIIHLTRNFNDSNVSK